MKILLSADWHLKPKHPFTQIEEGKVWDRMCQEKLNTLRKLPKYAEKLNVSHVVIAGDVFDTSNPPEALKAEFVKIIKNFPEGMQVIVITGRPGDHDYVSENNYVLMDIKEALSSEGDIYIHNSNFFSLKSHGLLITHLMLEGINDLYKKVTPLDDPMFKDYNTILLGDYHAYYHKKYGQKTFIYPGTPYPTRYGEDSHGIVVCEFSPKGKLTDHKHYNLKTYKLLELNSLDASFDTTDGLPLVIKYKIKVDSKELSKTLRKLEELKKEHIRSMMGQVMDVVWQVNTIDSQGLEFDSESNFSLDEIVESYIEENAGKYVKPAWKLYKKLEAVCS